MSVLVGSHVQLTKDLEDWMICAGIVWQHYQEATVMRIERAVDVGKPQELWTHTDKN